MAAMGTCWAAGSWANGSWAAGSWFSPAPPVYRPIVARMRYSPPQAPKQQYDGQWMRTQLALIAQAIPPSVTRTIVADATIQVSDDTILCDATAGPITLTLYSAFQVQFLKLTIKKVDASANAVTIDGTVDGVSSRTLAAQYDGMTIQSDGTNWYLIGTV